MPSMSMLIPHNLWPDKNNEVLQLNEGPTCQIWDSLNFPCLRYCSYKIFTILYDILYDLWPPLKTVGIICSIQHIHMTSIRSLKSYTLHIVYVSKSVTNIHTLTYNNTIAYSRFLLPTSRGIYTGVWHPVKIRSRSLSAKMSVLNPVSLTYDNHCHMRMHIPIVIISTIL